MMFLKIFHKLNQICNPYIVWNGNGINSSQIYILQICKESNIDDVKEDLQQYINQQFNSKDRDSYKNLQNLLTESFRISFRNSYASFSYFEDSIKSIAIIKISNYIKCLEKAIEYKKNPKEKFYEFFGYFFSLCKDNRQSVFWVNQDGQTFIELFIQKSKGKEQAIFEFIKFVQGYLLSKVYSTLNIDTVLFRILRAIKNSDSDKKPQYAKLLLGYIQNRMIDLTDGDFDGYGSYQIQLVSCGVNLFDLEKTKKIIKKGMKQENEIQYIIYDLSKKGNTQNIDLGQEFNVQIRTGIKTIMQKGQFSLSCPNSDLKLKIKDGNLEAILTSNRKIYDGLLIPRIQPFVEEYEWQIFDEANWKKIMLKAERKNELMKHSKINKSFQLLITEEKDLKLQINMENFTVKKINKKNNKSQNFGILYWKPIFKSSDLKLGDKPQIQILQESDNDDINPQKMFSPLTEKEFIPIDIDTKIYPFLAILSNHIPSSCNYMIDEDEKSIKIFGPSSIRKMNKWLENLDMLIIECFTGNSTEKKQVKIKIPNKVVREKVRDQLFSCLEAEYRKNVSFSNNEIIIGSISRNDDLVRDYMNYLVRIEQENLKREKYTIVVPNEHLNSFKSLITQINDKSVQLDTNIENQLSNNRKQNQIHLQAKPQKIAALVEAVNNENIITINCPNFAGLLQFQQTQPIQYKQLAKNLKIDIEAMDLLKPKGQQTDFFSVTGKKIPVYAFWTKFNKFLQRLEKEKFDKQKVIIKLVGAGLHYKVLETQVSNILDTSIRLKGEDVEVETLRKKRGDLEVSLLNKIRDIKMEIIDKSIAQFQIKQIEESFAHGLCAIIKFKLDELKKTNNTNLGYVQFDLTNFTPRVYTFRLLKGNQEEIKSFNTIKINFKIRYVEYKRICDSLRRTDKIQENAIKPLRQLKINSREQRETLIQLIRKYKQKIHSLVEQIHKEKQKDLENNFLNFLNNKIINQKYECTSDISIINTLDSKNNGIFYQYLEELVDKKSQNIYLSYEELEKRKNYIINRVCKDVLELDQNLRQNKLQSQKVRNTILAIKALVASYFTTNLPIVSHLQSFAQCIKKYNNIVVKVGTGSGKSTILPPFLIGMGYKRVVVTQPRRLPCSMIYKRIKKTHSPDIVGFSYAGTIQCPENPLHYTTDGFLKVQLYANPDIVKQIDVLILDQIHERSRNIDLILAKIPELRKINPNLKVILCSATVDESIIQMIDSSKIYGVFTVQVQRYEVEEFRIENQSILQKANDLSGRLKRNQKMLIFFPGVDEVEQAVKTFNEKYKKLAYPLHGRQLNKEQDQIIEKGQIFVATSIAQTSLTFQNLKFVLDSRKARYVIFNQELGTYETQQKIASKSSITQRKGRVGRDCPGEYYFFQNLQTGTMLQDEFDLTELERSDLTNVVFELLIQYKEISKVRSVLKKLMNNSTSFNKKFKYSLAILIDYRIIDQEENVKTTGDAQEIFNYGNLGDIRFNIALAKANRLGCSEQVSFIVSFLMYGSKIIESVLDSIPPQKHDSTGDIMTLCNWMHKISQNIKLKQLSLKDIYIQACKFPEIRQKLYFSTIIKVFKQAKRLFYRIPNLQSCNDWNVICQSLMQKAFKNDLYFHEINLGGEKGNYSKLIDGKKYQGFSYKYNQIHYKISRNSLLYKQKAEELPSVVLSLNSYCNTVEDSILSFCSIPSKDCQKRIQFTFQSSQEKIPYDIQTVNEQQFLKNQLLGNYSQNKFNYKDTFNRISQWYKELSNKLFSRNIEIDLYQILQKEIKNNKIDERQAKMLKEFYEKINFYDIFSSMKYQFQNSFDVKIKIPFTYKKKLVISNASKFILTAIMKRIQSFFSWFVQCRNLCQQDKKVDPQLIHKKRIEPLTAEGIEKRINMVVDSSIEYHIVKSWTHSQSHYYSNRTMRMVAVCWILTTKFDCSIKGGFVRDWVIRNNQFLPKKDLTTILSRNPFNGHMEVMDPSVCPVDIDADLPSAKFFDLRRFYQQMLKLNISMQVSDPAQSIGKPDFWRIHIVFDRNSATGPFTADLIQPYCQISHDRCDFDVNLFYLKKDWKGALGLKIPLELRPVRQDNYQHEIKYTLEDLLKNCIDKNMKQINSEVSVDRKSKFLARGWKIDPIVYEPIVYKSVKTVSYRININQFNQTFPEFMQDMPKAEIHEVLQLKNSIWDSAYDSVRQWIINEGQKTNQKFLFHGTKEDGILGILQGSFDSRRFVAGGNYGRGAYFADVSSKSDSYSQKCPKFDNLKCMFLCKVALGKQEHCPKAVNSKLGPSPGYHSILGTALPHREYIIDRYGQAKPMFLIKYK